MCSDAALMPPPPPRVVQPRQASGAELFCEEALDVAVGRDVFRVWHLAGREGPLVLCLHGAGLTGLSFSALAPLLSSSAHCRVLAMV